MSEFHQKRLDHIRAAVSQAEGNPALIREAESYLQQAQSQIDHGLLANKHVLFGFNAHLAAAANALMMAIAEDDAVTGLKVREGGQKGHQRAYGDRPAAWAEYQATVDSLAADPKLNWTAIKRKTAKVHGVSMRCIQRNCQNPRK